MKPTKMFAVSSQGINNLFRAINLENTRDIWICGIFSHLKELNIRGLEILTGRDTIKIHRSLTFHKSYRTILIEEAKAMFLGMSDDRLQWFYSRIPFTFSPEPKVSEIAPKKARKFKEPPTDERDWDCRPSTIGEVTENDLDRELEDYFLQDPDVFRKHLDTEIEQYMLYRDPMDLSD